MPNAPLPAGAVKAVERLDRRDESLVSKRERKLKSLARQVGKEVMVDKPLPAQMLTRYVAMVSLTGIDGSVGREQVDWTNTLLRTIRLEAEVKKMEGAEDTEKDFTNLESIFRGSEALKAIIEEEADDEEE